MTTYTPTSKLGFKKRILNNIKKALVPLLYRKWIRDPQVLNWIKSGLFREKEIEHLLFEWQKFGSASARPHKLKQQLIQKYQAAYNCNVLVETGTFLGDMLEAQKIFFETLYSIELSETLCYQAQQRFKNTPSINVIQGDSGLKLKELVPKINSRILFWLDGHYSGGITAKGELECPIFEELKSIFSYPSNHVILIDDARYFIGKRDYPKVEELEKFIKRHAPNYSILIEEDAIIVVPS